MAGNYQEQLPVVNTYANHYTNFKNKCETPLEMRRDSRL